MFEAPSVMTLITKIHNDTTTEIQYTVFQVALEQKEKVTARLHELFELPADIVLSEDELFNELLAHRDSATRERLVDLTEALLIKTHFELNVENTLLDELTGFKFTEIVETTEPLFGKSLSLSYMLQIDDPALFLTAIYQHAQAYTMYFTVSEWLERFRQFFNASIDVSAFGITPLSLVAHEKLKG